MEKETRIKYVAFYPDDFYEHPEVITMSIREQQQWLMLLTKIIRLKGRFPDNMALVARLIGVSVSEARKFTTKLLEKKLLIQEYNELKSPRMIEEYNKALQSCLKKSENGLKGANKRWGKTGKVIDFPTPNE